jgi:hypothetical protein
MVSVYQVYQSLKDLANKEQKGFITPQVFNNFASLAQMNIYNEMFSELVDARKISRQNFDPGRDKSVRKQKLEDLSFFIKRKSFTLSIYGEETLYIDKPSDLSKIISALADSVLDSEDSDVVNYVPCQIVYDPEKMNYLKSSNLSAPSLNFPVMLVSGNKLEVFPDTVEQVELTYYGKPTSFDSSGVLTDDPPTYAFVASAFGGQDVEFFNSNNSRDFHLPPHYLTEVVMEMAKLIGVRLRDPNVTSFAAQEEASE